MPLPSRAIGRARTAEVPFLPERTISPLTLPREAGLGAKGALHRERPDAFEVIVVVIHLTVLTFVPVLFSYFHARRDARRGLQPELAGAHAVRLGQAGWYEVNSRMSVQV
jgi:hypothetical protein